MTNTCSYECGETQRNSDTYILDTSQSESLDSNDAPHDERISKGWSKSHTKPSPVFQESLVVPKEERIVTSSNTHFSVHTRSPLNDIIQIQENRVPSTNDEHANTEYYAYSKPPIPYYDDNIDSVLTDSHESSGSFLNKNKDSPNKTCIRRKVDLVSEHNAPQLMLEKDDMGIPISITIFRSNSAGMTQGDMVITANNSSCSTLDEGRGKPFLDREYKDTSITTQIDPVFMVLQDSNRCTNDPWAPGQLHKSVQEFKKEENQGSLLMERPKVGQNVKKSTAVHARDDPMNHEIFDNYPIIRSKVLQNHTTVTDVVQDHDGEADPVIRSKVLQNHTSLVVPDIENDGDADPIIQSIVIQNQTSVDDLAQNHDGEADPVIRSKVLQNQTSLVVPDIENDGDADPIIQSIVIQNQTSVDDLAQNHDGEADPVIRSRVLQNHTSLVVPDIENDGDADPIIQSIVIQNQTSVDDLAQNHDGEADPVIRSRVLQNQTCLVVPDIENDGDSDPIIQSIVIQNQTSVDDLAQNHDGEADPVIRSRVLQNQTSLVVPDVENDGDADPIIQSIVIQNQTSVDDLAQNHDGEADPVIRSRVLQNQTCLVVPDIENDGDADPIIQSIVIQNQTSVDDLAQNHDGEADPVIRSRVLQNHTSLVVPDIENDGDADPIIQSIVIQNQTSVDDLAQNHDGEADPVIRSRVLQNQTCLVVPDIENDGDSDPIIQSIVIQNQTSVDDLAQNHDGEADPVIRSRVLQNQTSLVVPNVENDGDADPIIQSIVIQNQTSVDDLAQNHDGEADPVIRSRVLQNQTSLVVPDVENDGDADPIKQPIVIQNQTSVDDLAQNHEGEADPVIRSRVLQNHTSLVVPDVEYDGDADPIIQPIVIQNQTSVDDLAQNHEGEADPVIRSRVLQNQTCLVVPDVDNDGDADPITQPIVIQNQSSPDQNILSVTHLDAFIAVTNLEDVANDDDQADIFIRPRVLLNDDFLHVSELVDSVRFDDGLDDPLILTRLIRTGTSSVHDSEHVDEVDDDNQEDYTTRLTFIHNGASLAQQLDSGAFGDFIGKSKAISTVDQYPEGSGQTINDDYRYDNSVIPQRFEENCVTTQCHDDGQVHESLRLPTNISGYDDHGLIEEISKFAVAEQMTDFAEHDSCNSSICDQSEASEEVLSELLGQVTNIEIGHLSEGNVSMPNEELVHIHNCDDVPPTPIETVPCIQGKIHSPPSHTSSLRDVNEIWKNLQNTNYPAIKENAPSILLSEDDDMVPVYISPELDGEPHYISSLEGVEFVLNDGTVLLFDGDMLTTFNQPSKFVAVPRETQSQHITGKQADDQPVHSMDYGRMNAQAPVQSEISSDHRPLNSSTTKLLERKISNLTVAKGSALARISLKSMITKKWREIYWIIIEQCLLVFRSKEDADYWLMNARDKNRDILIKCKIDFQKDIMDRSGIRAYKVTDMKSKLYEKGSDPLFQFKIERWTDVSVHNVAAFASSSKIDLWPLYQAIHKCL